MVRKHLFPTHAFYDEGRPRFTGRSYFPLLPTKGRVYWVEPGAPGYFVAYDRNNDGRITEASELFSSASFDNGFEHLKEFDSNGDGRINARDARFGQLLAWKDENGDGVSETKELQPLSALGVVSISLKYSNKSWREIGDRAELRQNPPSLSAIPLHASAGRGRSSTTGSALRPSGSRSPP